ncbi:MAG: response regulator receiver protein [Pseudolabrys sp.]|nr:response regulator receiver protein [Pseudolabrys sp.]MDP2295126.1 response regulator receiver protein [Pseudolabrys sp.]
MRIGLNSSSNNTCVVVLTADAEFESSARAIFGASSAIELVVVPGRLADVGDTLNVSAATVVVVDLDAGRAEEMAALARLTARIGQWPPVIAITQVFDETVARTLMQMRVADFLVKPIAGIDLVRACASVGKGTGRGNDLTEAQIYTFLPAVGGAGVTTLAIQTAMLLLNSGGPRANPSTCLLDLEFQHGAVADYLDLEPRLNLAEIEPRPDRLDRQLLEVMLSYHASGLAVVAAPNRPAEMRTFDLDVVTRLLDLVSANFEYVVFDMPRTWFSWTDRVLLGSNKLYIVSESTVPGLRHAKQLVSAIKERLGEGPNPQVIVNRFEQRMFSSGLRLNDVRQALGESFVSAIPNDYALVREAIDRGVPLDEVKPGNRITTELKKLVLPAANAKAGHGKPVPLLKKLKLSAAR